MNQKVIVEINNSHHYKVIEGVEHLNLKSQFRQRVLEKNGYKFYTIKVDDLSASNYSMLEEIYKIVEESGSMKQHK